MKKFKCLGCGKIKKFDPRRVPTQCPHCNALYSFIKKAA